MNTAITTGVGLVPILTQTIGTAVSSVTVSNAFSATYDSYKIIVFNATGSASGFEVYIKFNNSTGSTYCMGASLVSINAGTIVNNIANNVSSGIGVATTGSGNYSFTSDVFNPFAAASTHVSINYSANSGATTKYTGYGAGFDTNAVSQTGFSIVPFSGTLTGGTIQVYGYKK
jgi:hypothetical protein